MLRKGAYVQTIHFEFYYCSHDDVGWLKTVDQYYYGGEWDQDALKKSQENILENGI